MAGTIMVTKAITRLIVTATAKTKMTMRMKTNSRNKK